MKRKEPSPTSPSPEFLPRDLALRRTDDLLRAMLRSPPDPHQAPKKPKKRAKK